ncbi:MAG: hypothetical protein Aurels2KO_02160 [Aureliella sp.]
MTDTDNEKWLLETSNSIIATCANGDDTNLAPADRLIYCLWIADYGMRNAGDLTAAADLAETFHTDGRFISAELGLPRTTELFLLDTKEFERGYFDVFDDVCNELRGARH